MNNILNNEILGNKVSEIAIVLLFLTLSFIALRIFKYVILKKLKVLSKKTDTTWDDFLIATLSNSAIPILFMASIYVGLKSLKLSQKFQDIAYVAVVVVIAFYVLRVVNRAFRKFVYSFIQLQENSEAKQKQASGLITIVNTVIWLLGAVFIIDNLGYDVTTLIAGLGIGGIAIALAAQAILGDLFSYFVIFFDKPFEIGDFVVIEDKNGVIEYIGIKTTRIKTLSGEQLVCSNTDLTNSRVHNFKKMERRRIVFNLGVTYQTTHSELKDIPKIVRRIIESADRVKFDRGHFSGYGDFSLNFEFVYYILEPDYSFYMDRQQEIYLEIFEAFENRGIEFAFPTQTIFTQPINTGQKEPMFMD